MKLLPASPCASMRHSGRRARLRADGDTYVIGPAGAQQVVVGFRPGLDTLVLSSTRCAGLRRLELIQDGENTVIALAGGQTVILEGVCSASLRPEDVAFD